jgi:hypothetical protein
LDGEVWNSGEDTVVDMKEVKQDNGTQAERYWSVLPANINDLARCHNLTPLGV